MWLTLCNCAEQNRSSLLSPYPEKLRKSLACFTGDIIYFVNLGVLPHICSQNMYQFLSQCRLVQLDLSSLPLYHLYSPGSALGSSARDRLLCGTLIKKRKSRLWKECLLRHLMFTCFLWSGWGKRNSWEIIECSECANYLSFFLLSVS